MLPCAVSSSAGGKPLAAGEARVEVAREASGVGIHLAGWVRWHEAPLISGASIVGFFVLWQVAAMAGWVNHLFFSSPVEVAQAAAADVVTPDFWNNFWESTLEFVFGFSAAVVAGVPLGLILGWYRGLGDLLDPWLSFFYALPRIALIPIILMWIGLTIWSIVTVVFLGAFFQILLNTMKGPRVVDARLANVARSYHASQRLTITTLVLPSSLPYILSGLRLGTSRAITGVVIGEFFAATSGLGHVIFLTSISLESGRLLFATILLIALGVIAVEMIHRVERRFSAWRDDYSTAV